MHFPSNLSPEITGPAAGPAGTVGSGLRWGVGTGGFCGGRESVVRGGGAVCDGTLLVFTVCVGGVKLGGAGGGGG